ncbi:hypothetical protein [Bacillus sp. V59.32b]|uniref:hypothetical protein n=1 Tax=Bacillus sp. V59.32b TaxID=1758642 RepID=UPI000E3D1603|nr:hypothetical protein [Bacillus sp. V59.32b]RFU60207.1 hypothetical protein D0463_18085 [Bacillus sp. V59.32b]
MNLCFWQRFFYISGEKSGVKEDYPFLLEAGEFGLGTKFDNWNVSYKTKIPATKVELPATKPVELTTKTKYPLKKNGKGSIMISALAVLLSN